MIRSTTIMYEVDDNKCYSNSYLWLSLDAIVRLAKRIGSDFAINIGESRQTSLQFDTLHYPTLFGDARWVLATRRSDRGETRY